jgi:hypothetical protein
MEDRAMNLAAQALGRLAKGRPKHYSAAEIERRTRMLLAANARWRAAKLKQTNDTKGQNENKNDANGRANPIQRPCHFKKGTNWPRTIDFSRLQ